MYSIQYDENNDFHFKTAIPKKTGFSGKYVIKQFNARNHEFKIL